jgi:hypothetical protein
MKYFDAGTTFFFNGVTLLHDRLEAPTRFRGLHWPQSNYASISSRLTPATIVGLAVHYLRTFGTCECHARRSDLPDWWPRGAD